MEPASPEHGAVIDGAVRQSTLRALDECPQAAQWDAQGFQDWSSPPAAMGTAFHMIAEAMLRTLQQQGEQQMPTQEAVEVMMEVIARPDCPHLSNDQMRVLRIMVLNFCDHTWSAKHVRLEERMFADVPCPDGVTRRITAKPDALFPFGGDAALVVDWKTGWAVPPRPRGWTEDDGAITGEQYLSERGSFQLDCYGLIVMRTYPKVQRVLLREFFVRINEVREAELHREHLEHVERRLGVLAQRWDMLVNGQVEPEARPGTWCSHCPKPLDCPIPWQSRVGGAITDDEKAYDVAQLLTVIEPLREWARKEMKVYLDAADVKNVDVNGALVGWDREGAGRRFDIHKRAEP